MIHDLDLVLDCIDSPLATVSASGQAILGGHEDWAEARLQFENGAVADLFASRVSRVATRHMSMVGCSMSAELDFSTGTCEIVEPCEEVIQGTFNVESLPDEERRTIQKTLFERWLPCRKLDTVPTNAIEMELKDFHRAIQSDSAPVVSGRCARAAIEVAERILEAVAEATQRQSQAREAEEIPSVIPAAHRFGVRRAS
jgi:predicted dehydrogenase